MAKFVTCTLPSVKKNDNSVYVNQAVNLDSVLSIEIRDTVHDNKKSHKIAFHSPTGTYVTWWYENDVNARDKDYQKILKA